MDLTRVRGTSLLTYSTLTAAQAAEWRRTMENIAFNRAARNPFLAVE